MTLEDLHSFWFGAIQVTSAYYQEHVPRWFYGEDQAFDRACQSFTPLFFKITPFAGTSAREHLSKILLFDQIPRNSYRDGPSAHAFDLTACHLTLEALGTPLESELSYPEKLFLYLPLEHAEDLDFQNLSVKKYSELHERAPNEIREWTELALRKANEHRKTIERFGRFPQRNLRLGRESTPEEKEYLLSV